MIIACLNYANDIRPWLEGFYFLSGVALTITIFISLRQLRMQRDIFKISLERESATLTANLIKEFVEKTLRDIEDIYKISVEKKFPTAKFIDVTYSNLDFPKVSAEDYTLLSSYEDVWKKLISLLNKIEIFSLYFTKGNANEKIAFPVVGRVYCHFVKVYSEVLSCYSLDINGYDSEYESIIDLYNLWKPRCKK